MAKTRFEVKVGLFVLLGLVLLAAMTLLFSKGFSFEWDVYRLQLRAGNVGGLKLRAAALMSGVQVGSVSAIKLAPDGKSVLITLKLDNRIKVYSDARFVIEQSGFLGDQYVAIVPTENRGKPLENGAEVPCEEPFNMLEVARNASGFIARIDDVAKKLDDAMSELRKYVLNERTLSNFSATFETMRTVSDRALAAMNGVNGFVQTNTPPLATSISNLTIFSAEMSRFSSGLNDLVDTNRAEVSAAIKNIERSSEDLRLLVSDLQAGKGTAGHLLKDEQIAVNLSLVSSNLAITSSNLNQRGLWGILWAPKQPKAPRTNEVARPVYTGRSPFK